MFPFRIDVGVKAGKPRPVEEGVVVREDNVRKAVLEKFNKDAEIMLKNALKH